MIPRSNIDSAINEVLRASGTATPPSGMEGRILTRLASERIRMEAVPARPSWLAVMRLRMPVAAMPVLGFVSAGLVCGMIVIGSVSYSHRAHSVNVPVPAPVSVSSQGIGAASAVHPAAPASAPVAAGPTSRGRSARRSSHARAHVSPHARKAPGVIVAAPSSRPQN